MRTEASEVTADHLDIVHTVTERYDGPVRGIAEFRGRPHYYERQFNAEADEWSEIYWLMPIDEETFRLAMEAWGDLEALGSVQAAFEWDTCRGGEWG
jgi:hypothetical protein